MPQASRLNFPARPGSEANRSFIFRDEELLWWVCRAFQAGDWVRALTAVPWVKVEPKYSFWGIRRKLAFSMPISEFILNRTAIAPGFISALSDARIEIPCRCN